METNSFEKAKKMNIAKMVEYSENGIVSKKVTVRSTGNITLFSFDKGQKLSEHTAPFDATIMILEGTAEILIDGRSNILEAGELIIMPANIPHAVNAVEKFKMLLIMIKE